MEVNEMETSNNKKKIREKKEVIFGKKNKLNKSIVRLTDSDICKCARSSSEYCNKRFLKYRTAVCAL